eukprot:TRINITY_DN620_c0_g1_i2.p1 TRINITY_DN620_c0_g1~~TRINITY_DN620_c0_g1_i2.p1  ORF type:complete len:513 (+),score=88.67 TRINITY_DN620_c0_g1_i2:80-1618(+)
MNSQRNAVAIVLVLAVVLLLFIGTKRGYAKPEEDTRVKEEDTRFKAEDLHELVQKMVTEQTQESIRNMMDGIQLRPNFLKPELIPEIREKVVSNDVVLLTAEYTYREVLMNWIANAEKQGIHNWIICCFDNILDDWLKMRGTRCHITIPPEYLPSSEPEILPNRYCRGQAGYTIKTDSIKTCLSQACTPFYNTNCLGVSYTREGPDKGTCVKCEGNPRDEFVSGIPKPGTDIALYVGKHKIWHLRWLAAMDIMALGLNIAFVDLDAIVVKNFFEEIHKIPTDVVAQRDFGPNKAVAVWGNSICMGFSYWRVGTRKRNEIIKNVERILQRSGDDQSSVANALLIEGVRFPSRLGPNDTIPKVGVSPTGYSLAMLPLSSYTRKCPNGAIERDAHIIAHCVFGGTTLVKKNTIRKLGGWLLTNNWEDHLPKSGAPFSEYLKEIVNTTTAQCYDTKKSCAQQVDPPIAKPSNTSASIERWISRSTDVAHAGGTTEIGKPQTPGPSPTESPKPAPVP